MHDTSETFEQYAARKGASPADPHYEPMRELWGHAQLAHLSYPATIPPCPSWCVQPDGHEYDSTATDDPTRHFRYHSSVPFDNEAAAYVRVEAEEWNRCGEVVVATPKAVIYDGDRSLTAGEARQVAADLLAAADLLDGITQ